MSDYLPDQQCTLIIETMTYFINIQKNQIISFKYINILYCNVLDVAKFNVNMALVGELDIVHVYGSVSVTARVCRVRLPASPAATLEVAGRLVMSGGVFACTLTVNTPVEAVPSEHCNVRA